MQPSVPEPVDLASTNDAARALEQQVRTLVERSEVHEAARLLEGEWEAAAVAHLPARVPFVISRLDTRGVRAFLAAEVAADGVPPKLRLVKALNPRRPELVGVMLADAEEAVGFLPSEAMAVLERAGADAAHYSVRFLTISGVDVGEIHFECELVRPDLQTCVACGQLHADPADKCGVCVTAKKRKRPRAEAVSEHNSVPLAGAFRTVAEAAAKERDGRV